jgi:cyanophycin synthetase
MQFVDSWRLFGANLQTRGPATLVEVAFDAGDDAEAAVGVWKEELSRMAADLGVPVLDAAGRLYRGGAVLTFSGAIDVLLPLTDMSEWAARSAASILSGAGPRPSEPARTELRAALLERRSPRLLSLEAEATRRALPLIWDDEGLTLGAGKASQTWAPAALPTVDQVPWSELGSVPMALVTGTNGKTTSVRLLARILKHAGHRVGMTTTDGVWVDEQLVLPGDYTGPAGATAVLRTANIDAAVLETARGGILRRGLAVRSADVALITNVSDDHLGHYGIDDLDSLARVKAVVGSVVPASGRVVVNAEDPHVLGQAAAFAAPLVLYSVDPMNACLVAHRAAGGEAWTLQDGWLIRASGETEARLVPAADVPIGFGGAARYNLANALGAAACARVLGAADGHIREGLSGFTSSRADNPGRGNHLRVSGVDVLVDFAHNPDGIRNVLALVEGLRTAGGRLAIIGGYAGDRSNDSIRDAARAISDARPSRVFLRDLAGYLRGRAPGEVPARLVAELVALGLSRDAVEIAPSEADALRRALDWAVAGDFVVVLAHLESAAVSALLAERR